ncbi:MAG: arylsulfatase [Acidobacteria bacterium]|nr:arylsulfatase [Acidobacteriota bacterium]
MKTALTFLLALAGAFAADRPNIVFLLADDLGWANVGFHGAKHQTPNIDRLAREGVELERYYVYPVCSPTRAGLMTGRSSMRTGVIYSVVRPWERGGLPLDEHLLPETLRANGYETAMAGKWHLGHSRAAQLPNARGFDHYYGHVNGAIDYYTHQREGGIDWQRDGKTVIEEGYSTELFASEAQRLIRSRNKAKPLFLYVAFNAPHAPLQAPAALIDKYAYISDPRQRTYAAMVDALDTAIGKILATLEAEGLTRNTLVLFHSDNGGPLQQGAVNTPLRAGKATTFEGGIRVPTVVRWPAQVQGGRKVAQVITNLDIFPTLCSAAGIKPGATKPLDGRDMWPAIVKGENRRREDLFFAVDGRLAVRHKQWKLVRDGGQDYLFRIEEDPNEQNDLAAQNPEVAKDLAARIEAWQKLHPENGIRPSNRPPDGWKGPRQWAEAAR